MKVEILPCLPTLPTETQDRQHTGNLMGLPTYTKTAQWSVLTSRSEAWKTRRQWPHKLGPHTWEGLTNTVKPLAGRWPSSHKLIGRHIRRHTCKVVCREEASRPAVSRNLYETKVILPYSCSECKSVALPTLEVEVLSVFALSASCITRLLTCGTEERPCWSFRTQTSSVIIQIGWQPTHVFNKYSPQIVGSSADQSRLLRSSHNCLERLLTCGTDERSCWSFRTQTSTVIIQIGWKPTHVFNKNSPQIVVSSANQLSSSALES